MRKDETTDECTFWPNLRSGSERGERSLSGGNSSNGNDPIYVKGYDEFLQRQEQSRKLQEERKARLQSDGTKWRNEVTVPEEFKFGKRVTEQISCLRRPMRAPLRHGVNDTHEVISDETVMPQDRRTNPFAGASMPPAGAFSERSSAAIIDAVVVRKQEY